MFEQLISATKSIVIKCDEGSSRAAVCPSLGGRVFAEVCGAMIHRLDVDLASNPEKTFNNYGGNVLWPAPEGGKFAFNYDGDRWYVQDAVNLQPFEVRASSSAQAAVEKSTALINRAGTKLETRITRTVTPSDPPEVMPKSGLRGHLSYITSDAIQVLNPVSKDEALIAAWTLEQFDATDDTVAFGVVDRSGESINFDYYERPGARITYFNEGFTYKTDGRKAGQIGIAKSSAPRFIGFYDLARKILCVRENLTVDEGIYFNIADNEQPGGPYSAADVYSIFNSDADGRFFELETIGPMLMEGALIKGSTLISKTSIGVYETASEIEDIVAKCLKEQAI